jgi:putative sporulation protein YyaC
MATLERVHYEAYRASSRIKKALWTQAREAATAGRPLTIVGVGSAFIVGDAIGPYVASKLADHANRHGTSVYGTLRHPVHAQNIVASAQTIKAMQDRPFVIAVDAAVAVDGRVGFITTHDDPLRPGAGVGKTLTEIGDVSIMGGTSTSRDPVMFAYSDFALVVNMGDVIVQALKSLITDYAKVQRKGATAR